MVDLFAAEQEILVLHDEEGDEDVFDDIMDGSSTEPDEEEIFAADDGSRQDESTNKWDRITSALEDTLLDETFEQARIAYCRQHCQEFEDTCENKLVYTTIFQHYCELVEHNIEQQLGAKVQGFSMLEFAGMLTDRQQELDAEVFDLLTSIGDFDTFKSIMLAYKDEQQRGGELLQLQCCAMELHGEEQEEGDVRPDLDMSLCISPILPSSPSMAAVTASTGAAGTATSSIKAAG
eukprot:gene3192-3470_t